jgi:hypothetical protein
MPQRRELSMIPSVRKKRVAIMTGSVGVLVIMLGFVIASTLSCTEIHMGYGPSEYKCPDGVYFGVVNPHPYFDMLFPWLLGGILILLWAAYRYRRQEAPTRVPPRNGGKHVP